MRSSPIFRHPQIMMLKRFLRTCGAQQQTGLLKNQIGIRAVFGKAGLSRLLYTCEQDYRHKEHLQVRLNDEGTYQPLRQLQPGA